jgi:hypothetical protein
MSNKLFSLAVAAALLALPMSQLFAQGDDGMDAPTVLLLDNQQEIAGRLLSTRDPVLLIPTDEAHENHCDVQTESVTMAKALDIQRVSSKDDSNVRKGALLGFLIGAGTGAIIGLAAGDDPGCSSDGMYFCFSFTAEQKAAIGGLLGGGAGLIVGSIVGAITSK